MNIADIMRRSNQCFCTVAQALSACRRASGRSGPSTIVPLLHHNRTLSTTTSKSNSFIRTTRRLQPSKRCSRSYASSVYVPRVLINDLRSQEVVVEFEGGNAIRYPSFWLRDHCPCSECTHPHTKQRQLDTFSLHPETKANEVSATTAGLQVVWSDSNHASLYPWSWLQQHEPFTAKPRTVHQRSQWQHVSPSSSKLPAVNYDSVMTTDAGLSNFLAQIRTYGLSFIEHTPPTPEATQALLERIAVIRVTHYGGFWDFTSEAKPIDTAYTNLALPAHTDNTYFTDPCGLQLFHVLTPSTSGGESTFVDGFAAAQHLHKHYPTLYQSLSQIPVISHASGDPSAGNIFNTSAMPSGYPVFAHATPHQPALYKPTNLTQIRWNNADRASATVWPSHQSMSTWYNAARVWSELLASKEFELKVKLQPGTPVIFDNWRTLHGRKAFEGERRVCGGYIGMDDFLAKGRLTDQRRLEESARDVQEGKQNNEGSDDIGMTRTENDKLAAMGGS